MTKLTSEEKIKVYKRAIKELERNHRDFRKYNLSGSHSLCSNIKNSYRKIFGSFLHTAFIKDLFPEFELFRPEDKSYCSDYWWDQHDYKSRIACMLLCIQIAKSKN